MCVYTLLGCPHDATTLSRLTMIGALARANCAGARANICNCVIAIYERRVYYIGGGGRLPGIRRKVGLR